MKTANVIGWDLSTDAAIARWAANQSAMMGAIRAGSLITTTMGKTYRATGRVQKMGDVLLVPLESTPENDFRSAVELRSVANVENDR